MKRKILFISHSPYIAGAELCLLNLIKSLDRNVYDGLVLVPAEGSLSSRVAAYGWKVEVFPVTWWVSMNQRNKCHFRQAFGGIPNRVKRIRALIRTHQVGLVYTNTITCLDGAISAKLEHIPHIWHIHELPALNDNFKFYCPMWMVRKIVHCLSTKVIVPSRIVKNDIQQQNDGKIEVIPNGVNPFEFAEADSRKFLEEIALPIGTKIVCMLGAIYEIKRPFDFLEAARIVSEKIDNVVFMLVGACDDCYLETIRNKIENLGLSKRFLLMGFRSDVSEILHSIDLLVSASTLESFSLVLLEAMASAKPVVATRSGGPEDIVVNGVTGLLVNRHNPKEIAEAILLLLTNEDKATEMGRQGHKRVNELFTIDKYTEGVQRIINQCF